jgi:dihydroxyacid dehydratase/phosphogluconate dehydratase
VTGQTIAENLKSVTWHPHPEALIGGPIELPGDGYAVEIDVLETDAGIAALNVKLTDGGLAGRKTKWKARATNHTSGVLGTFAQQVGPAVDGLLVCNPLWLTMRLNKPRVNMMSMRKLLKTPGNTRLTISAQKE